jgi:CHASE3 domain sensor protein
MSAIITQKENSPAVTHVTSSTYGSNSMADISRTSRNMQTFDEVREDSAHSTNTIPNGIYGWTIVTASFIIQFRHNGIINCWGVL